MTTWNDGHDPEHLKLNTAGWCRAVIRALPLAILVFGGLLVLLLIRMIERPFFGLRRPVTPYITQFVCRGSFAILGIGYAIEGTPMRGAGAVVANHSSWLDIFALNAGKRIYFVSKSEVAGWPGIGWLARATGTVFIKRDRGEATKQITVFKDRLSAGHKLLFFPEGTSTDGRQVLDFKPTLFAAFFDPALADTMKIQPVTLVYRAPQDEDARFYGWWGDMDFAPHLIATLGARRQGSVTVVYHQPVKLTDFDNRKKLAKACETTVRDGLISRLPVTTP